MAFSGLGAGAPDPGPGGALLAWVGLPAVGLAAFLLGRYLRPRPGTGPEATAPDLDSSQPTQEAMEEALSFQSALLENCPLGIALLRDRAFAWVNPRLEEILSLPASRLVGGSTRAFYPDGESHEAFGREASPILERGERYTGEIHAVRGNGERFWARVTGRHLNLRHPERGVIWLFEDITSRKAMEEALTQSHKAESLNLLAGGMAHDFNNTFQILQDNLEVMAEGSAGNARLERAILRSASTLSRAVDLARRLLEFSGRGAHRVGPLRMGQCAILAFQAMERIRPPGLKLILDLPPDPPALDGDAAQITQVLVAFLTNAMEACGPRGTVKLAIHPVLGADWKALRGTWIAPPARTPAHRVLIEDSGHGMEASVLARAFDPFFSTRAMGRGLGLSSALGILRHHGAGIQVETCKAGGCRVHLWFLDPLEPREAAAPFAVSGLWTREAPAGPRPTRTILLVDDEVILRETLRESLETFLGLEVLEARDGQEAVEIYDARGGGIDLIIMDATMPRMGGIEAFRRIRVSHPEARAILCSGYSDVMGTRSAAEHGFLGFLAKPFRLTDLRQVLTDLGLVPALA